MILVIDANILFSALIRNSLTANLLFNANLYLYTPQFIVDEFLKYENDILRRMSRTHEDFVQVMHMLKDIILTVQEDEYKKFMKDAEKISPDDKDVMYFALALKLGCAIWSNDARLKEQDKVKVYSTEDVVKMFGR
jgi:predicted nucleic acid-binding protein